MRGLFVTGTDTGVGKTVVAAAICAGLAAAAGAWPPSSRSSPGSTTRRATGRTTTSCSPRPAQAPSAVAPWRFGPPVSPHLAAELAGAELEPTRCSPPRRRAGRGADALVVEGVGGLLVPLTPGYLVRDLALDLGLPLVVAARPGLGTINHTLLTLEAARAAGLDRSPS